MITLLMQFLNQLHIFHWQTHKHSHHLIYGDLYDELTALTDELLEVSFGLGYSKELEELTINLKNIDDINISLFLNDYCDNICLIKESIPELTNICDTIIDTINRKKYLLIME